MFTLSAATYLSLCLTGSVGELVANPDFSVSGANHLPASWSFWTPDLPNAVCNARQTDKGLLMEAPGHPYAVGMARQRVQGVKGGQAYAVTAQCEIEGLPSPQQSLMVRVDWTTDGKLVHPAGMLVDGPVIEGNRAMFRDVFIAPEGADGAQLGLEVKWLHGGTVLWKQVSTQPTEPPAPRKVKVGAVHFRPRNSDPEKNLKLFCEQIDAAGKLGLDIVCLGETITYVGTSRKIGECAAPIPGPHTRLLGEAAQRNNIWVVAGLVERDGDDVFNTGVLIDRQGKLAGTYRKVHLPREEWKWGVVPGSTYPVFETDFGKVAIQICYDWFFPEPEAMFALQGAEIIFAPTWGTTFPDEDGRAEGETVFRVRARDNGVYMVPSVYDGASMIIDPMGRILASSSDREGVVWTEIDLNHREALPWVGHWRSIWPRHRMPETYRLNNVQPELPPSKP